MALFRPARCVKFTDAAVRPCLCAMQQHGKQLWPTNSWRELLLCSLLQAPRLSTGLPASAPPNRTRSSSMAKQAGRLWQDVLDHLAGMAAGDKSRSMESVTELLRKIESSPQQPKAAWKRLVQEMQVRGPAGSHASQSM